LGSLCLDQYSLGNKIVLSGKYSMISGSGKSGELDPLRENSIATAVVARERRDLVGGVLTPRVGLTGRFSAPFAPTQQSLRACDLLERPPETLRIRRQKFSFWLFQRGRVGEGDSLSRPLPLVPVQ
jgi:hypothetical protein